MKIDLTNNVQIDTDNLSDKEAEIAEAIHNLHKVCEKYDVTSFIRVITNNKKFIGSRTFTSVEANRAAQYDNLVAGIAEFLDETSQGNIAVMIANPPQSEGDTEKD